MGFWENTALKLEYVVVEQNQEETRHLVDFYVMKKHEIICRGDQII